MAAFDLIDVNLTIFDSHQIDFCHQPFSFGIQRNVEHDVIVILRNNAREKFDVMLVFGKFMLGYRTHLASEP